MAFLQGSTKEHAGHLFSMAVGRSWRERSIVTVNPNKLDCSAKEDRNALKVGNETNTVDSKVSLNFKKHLLLSTEITAKNYFRLALESTDHIIRQLTNGFKIVHNDIYDV